MGTRVIPSVFALSACSLSVFALLLPAGAQSPPGPGHSLASLDRFLDEQRIEWKVPGLAVAVVRDDRVIHEGVYGTTDGPNKAPITRQTLFGIGSVTKSMTVAVLQTLVEEGKLDWDRPVRDFAPDFRLRDPVTATVYALMSASPGEFGATPSSPARSPCSIWSPTAPACPATTPSGSVPASRAPSSFNACATSTSAPACARSISTTT
jgi:hypothetical protein